MDSDAESGGRQIASRLAGCRLRYEWGPGVEIGTAAALASFVPINCSLHGPNRGSSGNRIFAGWRSSAKVLNRSLREAWVGLGKCRK
jgi:hypothetical protein